MERLAKLKKGATVYVANCIEDGERFVSYFKTANPNTKFIKETAKECAQIWGAECTSVKVWVPKRQAKILDTKTGKTMEISEQKWVNWQLKESQFITILKKSTGKKMQTTRTKFSNWVAKNQIMFPKAVADYEILENYLKEEPRYKLVEYVYEQEPKDLWDADKSDNENVKDFEKDNNITKAQTPSATV